MRSNLKFDDFDLSLKEYAKVNHVPIILDEGLSFLINIIKSSKAKNILEVGAAIGYSSINMVKRSNAKVITIERDDNMYNEAIKNIKLANLEDKIKILHMDALEAFDEVKDNKFDLVFIDAAKAQYQKFFETYEKLLNPNGIIICDNMNFHMLKEKDQTELSRSVRGLVRKLASFEAWLLSNDNYDTTIYDIGDGLSISIRKE